jgi:hypothetical protein
VLHSTYGVQGYGIPPRLLCDLGILNLFLHLPKRPLVQRNREWLVALVNTFWWTDDLLTPEQKLQDELWKYSMTQAGHAERSTNAHWGSPVLPRRAWYGCLHI